ncbi:MAG: alpha/beta hydrolase-fold protein [Pseudomonadota bacterium]
MNSIALCAAIALLAVWGNSTAASTAQPTVSVLAEQLDMPGLDRKRQVRLYLPPGYAGSTKRYPVLYMHDAQNLFDSATAHAGEWQIDETLNTLAREGKLELIVVGIDNGREKRMTELNPWDDSEFGKGEGKRYMDFVVKTVKPLIDARYRTLPDRASTAIMGSSMGGLISHYAIHQHPDVFSKAGIFSPAYLIGKEAFNFVAEKPARKDARLYLLVGTAEGSERVEKAERMRADLVRISRQSGNTVLKVVPGGEHNEGFWRAEFRQAILWMFEKAPATTAAR